MSKKAFDVFRLAAAIELALVLCESAVASPPGSHAVLPLGGGHIQQIGLCFGIAFVINEIRELFWPSNPDQ